MSLILLVLMLCLAATGGGQVTDSAQVPPFGPTGKRHYLSPPRTNEGPLVVEAQFEFLGINEIEDESETFEFTGISTLRWTDPRQAFNPLARGTEELVYQGDYQFNELFAGWYPQLVLLNRSGMYERDGVVLRIQPDGSATLTEFINATAEVDMDMTRFPMDRHRLEAVFEVFGWNAGEVVVRAYGSAEESPGESFQVPQWEIKGLSQSLYRPASEDGTETAPGIRLIAGVDVQRNAFYIFRLVAFPLLIIVLLSFSVFWMERSAWFGDRVNVSFIGILTGVSYQILIGDSLPRISYGTLMHGYLNLCFLTMCATVVINLVVEACDKRGKDDLGDRIDRHCRWAFPFGFFVLNLMLFGATLSLG